MFIKWTLHAWQQKKSLSAKSREYCGWMMISPVLLGKSDGAMSCMSQHLLLKQKNNSGPHPASFTLHFFLVASGVGFGSTWSW